MTAVCTLWGVRLTFNFAKKGGYGWPIWKGEEDYRWAYVQKHQWMRADVNPVRWQLFNLVVICGYMQFLLMALALPVHIAYKNQDVPLSLVDFGLATLFLCLLAFEATADAQQYRFQTEKHRKLKAGAKLDTMEAEGFLSTGLWSLCRHPNYFAEQAMWVTVFLFSVPLEGPNWSLLGAFLLISLFFPSGLLSESISAGKYPRYSDYVSAKWMFFPFGGAYRAGKAF